MFEPWNESIDEVIDFGLIGARVEEIGAGVDTGDFADPDWLSVFLCVVFDVLFDTIEVVGVDVDGGHFPVGVETCVAEWSEPIFIGLFAHWW